MFPYKITNIEGNDGKELSELFKGQKAGFVQVGPKKWTLPTKYAEYAAKYYTFDLKPDDLWIMSYPRSGSTWMQELLWLINNKLDYDTSSKIRLFERVPCLESDMIFSDKYLEEVAEMNDNHPQVIKHIKNYGTPVLYSPYWEHIKEGWEKRNHPNFLFLFYEDLLRDLHGNIKKICTFLNKQMTDDEIKHLADHLHIDNFHKKVTFFYKSEIKGMMNPEAQGFIRRGVIGGNEEFDDDKIKLRGEKWFKENLAKTDIVFPEF